MASENSIDNVSIDINELLENNSTNVGLIGATIVLYGDIEFWMSMLFSNVLDEDENDDASAHRLFFRVQSEGGKLDIFDAMCRPKMRAKGLGSYYEPTYGAIKYAKKIRNQYAHARWAWNKVTGDILHLSFEEYAKATDANEIAAHKMTTELMASHVAYLQRTRGMLMMLTDYYDRSPDSDEPKVELSYFAVDKPPLRGSRS